MQKWKNVQEHIQQCNHPNKAYLEDQCCVITMEEHNLASKVVNNTFVIFGQLQIISPNLVGEVLVEFWMLDNLQREIRVMSPTGQLTDFTPDYQTGINLYSSRMRYDNSLPLEQVIKDMVMQFMIDYPYMMLYRPNMKNMQVNQKAQQIQQQQYQQPSDQNNNNYQKEVQQVIEVCMNDFKTDLHKHRHYTDRVLSLYQEQKIRESTYNNDLNEANSKFIQLSQDHERLNALYNQTRGLHLSGKNIETVFKLDDFAKQVIELQSEIASEREAYRYIFELYKQGKISEQGMYNLMKKSAQCEFDAICIMRKSEH